MSTAGKMLMPSPVRMITGVFIQKKISLFFCRSRLGMMSSPLAGAGSGLNRLRGTAVRPAWNSIRLMLRGWRVAELTSLLPAHAPVRTRSMSPGMKAETQSLGCSPRLFSLVPTNWPYTAGCPDEVGPLGLAPEHSRQVGYVVGSGHGLCLPVILHLPGGPEGRDAGPWRPLIYNPNVKVAFLVLIGFCCTIGNFMASRGPGPAGALHSGSTA